jgi:hypothetical protein
VRKFELSFSFFLSVLSDTIDVAYKHAIDSGVAGLSRRRTGEKNWGLDQPSEKK